MQSFCDILLTLQDFWKKQGCLLLQPYDIPAGAGTFHPATLLRSLDAGAWSVAYVAPSRRPTDGRYGQNPNRLGSYYQFQVLIKPSPSEIQGIYLRSLEELGIDTKKHDVRFIEDNWESPTLGAWGLGWEVWLDGMEVTQFTYFQQVGGIPCAPVPIEITYGVERLAMYIQGVESVFDIVFSGESSEKSSGGGKGGESGESSARGRVVTYGDVHLEGERQFSRYNFEVADTKRLFLLFDEMKEEAQNALAANLALPAYDCVMMCSHFFNMLDARNAIGVANRQSYILKIRELAKACAVMYKEQGLRVGSGE